MSNFNSTLSLEDLKRVLTYNPETGIFIWAERTGRRVKAGDLAGAKTAHGYIAIRVYRKNYLAHRLAYFYVNGKWPEQFIDHINGIRNDNRIENLRQATMLENNRNTKNRVTNTSGFKGVSFNRNTGRWVARLKIKNQRSLRGAYATAEEAGAAYKEFAKQAYGEFARY